MMNIVDELERLERLHRNGGLSDFEFEQAKTKLLRPHPLSLMNDQTDQQLKRLERRQQILDLEQEWLYERETYRVHGRGGSYLPSTADATIMAIIFGAVACTLIPMIFEGGDDAGKIVLVLIVMVIAVIVQFAKASAYERAEVEHEERITQLSNWDKE